MLRVYVVLTYTGGLSMTIEQLQAEVLKLPRPHRARLAEALISSLDEDSDVDQAWDDEVDLRYQRYLAGEENAVAAETALADLRAELLS
jgi:putative addiction module component (TIGR02574 family)